MEIDNEKLINTGEGKINQPVNNAEAIFQNLRKPQGKRGRPKGTFKKPKGTLKEGQETKNGYNETEHSTNIFCGMIIPKLTSNRKDLYNRLSESERNELSERVKIHLSTQEIEFINIELFIYTTNLGLYPTQGSANTAIKKLLPKHRLPNDVSPSTTSPQLDPKSDLDAMILQMPGKTPEDKIKNFLLFTDMPLGSYLTGTQDTRGNAIIHSFFNHNVWDRHHHNNDSAEYFVRPVRGKIQ